MTSAAVVSFQKVFGLLLQVLTLHIQWFADPETEKHLG